MVCHGWSIVGSRWPELAAVLDISSQQQLRNRKTDLGEEGFGGTGLPLWVLLASLSSSLPSCLHLSSTKKGDRHTSWSFPHIHRSLRAVIVKNYEYGHVPLTVHQCKKTLVKCPKKSARSHSEHWKYKIQWHICVRPPIPPHPHELLIFSI